MGNLYNSIDEVKEFYEQCKAFWIRQGDSEIVAACKAFWWDIVQLTEEFHSWEPAKEQFCLKCAGFKPGDPQPSRESVEAGVARCPEVTCV